MAARTRRNSIQSAVFNNKGDLVCRRIQVYGKIYGIQGRTNGEIKLLTPIVDRTCISKISCGGFWICILDEAGQVYTWGDNSHGQLGHGHQKSLHQPTIVNSFADQTCITDASCGSFHGGFVSRDGRLFMTGLGSYGRLGLGNDESVAVPTPVNVESTLSDVLLTVRRVSCGDRHTLALTNDVIDGKRCVVSFGDGGNGRLGLGDTENRHRPQLVKLYHSCDGFDQPQIAEIDASFKHSAARCESGRVYTWGFGAHGRLGHGSTDTELAPRRVDYLRRVTLRQVACGDRHTVFLDCMGRVFTTGAGDHGQLGHGTLINACLPTPVQFESKVTGRTISAGKNHTICLDNRSIVYCWGSNENQQLGMEQVLDESTTPVAINLSSEKKEESRQVQHALCSEDATILISARKTTLAELVNAGETTIARQESEDTFNFDPSSIVLDLQKPLDESTIPSVENRFYELFSETDEKLTSSGLFITDRKKSRSSESEPSRCDSRQNMMQVERQTMKKVVASKNVKGFSTWIEQHKAEPSKHGFGSSPRFPKPKEKEDPTVSIVQNEFRTPVLSFSFPRSSRSSISARRQGSESPGPAAYDPQLPVRKSGHVYRPQSPDTKQRRAHESRLKHRQNKIVSAVNKRGDGPSIRHISPGFRLGDGFDFSKVIHKRLEEARGPTPGPGTYNLC